MMRVRPLAAETLVRSLFLPGVILSLASYSYSDVIAQELEKERQAVVKVMPRSTVAMLSVWPKQMAVKDSMKMAPLEVFSAAGVEQIGIDPLKVERLDLMLGFPGPGEPQFGILVQYAEPIDLAELNPEFLDSSESQVDGEFEYYQLASDVMPGVGLVLRRLGEKQVLVGTKAFTKQMLTADGSGRLAQVVEQIQTSQDAMVVVDTGTMRPLLQGLIEGQMRAAPQELTKAATAVSEGAEFLAVRLMMDTPEKLQAVLVSSDERMASRTLANIDEMLSFLQQSVVADIKSGFPANNATGRATHAYIDRVSETIRSSLTPKLDGARVVLEVDDYRSASTVGTLTALLLPAVSSARKAAGRMQSSNNLKQLMLALLNFESAYRTFPAASGLDNDGEPMLSWRVAILPFVEEAELYQRFRLDEPWDSEHNLALLEEMPDVFKHPRKDVKPGHTVYQAAVGGETILRLKEPTRIQQVTDGTSNTIMIVEVAAEDAVPWTAPQDFDVDAENLAKRLFAGAENIVVAFCDGSVQSLSNTLDLETLKALFTRAGGERVQIPR